MDRIVAGMEGTPMVDGKSKSLVAYHEVGHAVCATLTPGHDPVQKVCWRNKKTAFNIACYQSPAAEGNRQQYDFFFLPLCCEPCCVLHPP